MLSMVLFISGGEIFVILMFILIFFGADKIPEFARMMGKGVREFKKATDEIKRELNDNTSGVLDDIKAIRDDMTGTLTREIANPMQETAEETAKTFEEYKDQYNVDYYYSNPDYTGSRGNEYQEEAQAAASPEATAAETPDNQHTGAGAETEQAAAPYKLD